jgi:hypothetical protein
MLPLTVYIHSANVYILGTLKDLFFKFSIILQTTATAADCPSPPCYVLGRNYESCILEIRDSK